MFARLSVKKPYTVIVGVILVIVLGVVSFMNMRTDLLPNIDLPYVVVYTTYVGASPEQVETTVTKPMEAALASTTDLKSVQSVSSENVSMVILEYEASANMDTALIEISSAVSQIEGGWNDSVGSPVIMKLNPDMLPVMVASVDYEGKDIYELSEYVNSTLMSDMEGINGVASVDASGIIEEQIDVVVRQSRIDVINNLILRDVDAELADVELELNDAQAQLDDGKRQLRNAKREALQQIDDMIAQLESGSAMLPGTIAQLQAQKAQLEAQRPQLVAAIAQLEAALNSQPSQEEQAAIAQMLQALAALEAQRDALQAQLDAMGENPDIPTNEEIAAQQQVVNGLQADVAANQATISQLQAYIADLQDQGLTEQEQAQLQALRDEIAALEAANAAAEATISANAAEIEAAQATLDAQQRAIVTAEETLAAVRARAESIVAAQSAVSVAQQQVAQAQAAIEALNSEIAALEAGIAANEQLIAENTAQLNALQNQQADQETIDALTAEIAKLEAAVAIDRESVQSKTAEKNALEQQLAETQSTIEQLNGAIVALEAGISSTQAVIDAKNSELSALQSQPTADQAAIDSLIAEIAELENRIAADRSTLTEKQRELRGMQEEAAADQGSIDTLTAEIAALESAIAENEQQLREKRAQLDALQSGSQAQIDALTAEIAALQATVNADRAELESKRSELSAMQQQETTGQAALSSAQAELALLSEGWTGTEVSEAQAAVEAARAAAEQTQAVIDAKTAENVTLRATVTQNQAAITAKQAEADALADQQMSAEDEALLAQAQAQLAEAQQALAANQALLAQAQAQLASMQAAQAGSPEAIQAQIDAIQAQIDAIRSSEAYQAYLAWQQLQQNPGEAQAQLQQLQQQLAQMDAGIAQLDAMITKLQNGILPGGLVEGIDEDTNINEALAQLHAAREQAVSQFADAESQLAAAAEELAKGREEFEKQRDEALKNANINELITMEMVATIIGAQNLSMPAGYVYEGDQQYLVRVGDEFASVDELKNLVLFKMGLDSVDEVRLMDVATVEITDNSDESFAIVNGNAAVTMSFSKQSTASTTEVSDEILATFDELSAGDSNLHFTPLMDQGVYIDMIVDSVLSNLVTGGILAVVILAIFLGNIRPTIIIACSIPLSVVTAIVCMYFAGVTLNMISLSGLALAIGMLVDNSIVVIDNIYRLRNEEGMPILKACVYGANQVAGALLSSTLTTICVFLPIVFLQGMTRQLFQDMALTIAFSLMASLLVALTLVPVMGGVLLRKQRKGKQYIFRLVQKIYTGLLRFCLKFKIIVLAAAIGMLVFVVMQVPNMGMVFLENMSSNQLSVNLIVPEDASFEETNEACARLVDAYMEIEGVQSVGVMSGGSGIASMTSGSDASGSTRSFYVVLDEESGVTSYDIEQEFYDRAEALGHEVTVNLNMMDMGALMGSGMQVNITGADIDVITKIGADIAGMMDEIEGCIEINDGSQDAVPQLSIVVDRAKASEYNLTVGQVMQTVATAINRGATVTQMTIDGKEMDVIVADGASLERTPDEVGEIQMKVTTDDGEEKINIADICDIDYTMSLASINRADQRRTLSVSCMIDDEHNVALLGRELQAKLDAYTVPEGYKVTVAGENETINTMVDDMALMILLAVILIMLIMIAQFQSFFSPFIVLFTIPLAFTGGLLALQMLGMNLSMTGLIGFLVLSGVVVNNGIVFVDSVNQMREAGMKKRAALIETGRIRLRPILMTAMTTILGMLPMALARGMGAEMMQSMAVVSIGGLVYATLMTLFVVPVLYDLFTGKKYKVRRIGDEDEIASKV